jgi:hypothetical protein
VPLAAAEQVLAAAGRQHGGSAVEIAALDPQLEPLRSRLAHLDSRALARLDGVPP